MNVASASAKTTTLCPMRSRRNTLRTFRTLSRHASGSQAFARYREVDEEMCKEMVDAID